MNEKAYILLSISIIVLLISCSPKLSNNLNPSGDLIFYPKESDTARIQYLTSFSNSLDIVGKQSAFKSSIVGKQEVQVISKPYGVSIKYGKIYVSDVTLKALDIIDLENKSFNYLRPEGNKSFGLPLNTFIDDDASIYVVDTEKHKVVVYNSNLNYRSEFGTNSLKNPTDLFIVGDNIYIVDSKNNRVSIFDKETQELTDYFPKSVVGNDDWLYTPTTIYYENEKFYISDLGDNNVKIFDGNGHHLLNVGSLGTQFGQFVRPKGIAADNEGNFYVVDGAFENVQIFNESGQLLMSFGGPYKYSGDMYLPTQITIDYDNLSYFEHYVDSRYDLKYLILVANQFGPDKINVYGRIEQKK